MSRSSGIGIGMKELLKLTLADELKPEADDNSEARDRINSLEEEVEKLRARLDNNSEAPDTEKIYKKGLGKLKEGLLTEALEAFSTVLYFEPSHLKALNNAGVVYFELGLEEAAAGKFRNILDIEPDNETARENLENIEENLQ